MIPIVWHLPSQRALASELFAPGEIRENDFLPPGDWNQVAAKVPSLPSLVSTRSSGKPEDSRCVGSLPGPYNKTWSSLFHLPCSHPKDITYTSFNLLVESPQQKVEGNRSKKLVLSLPSSKNLSSGWRDFFYILFFFFLLSCILIAQWVKNLPAMQETQETWAWSLGCKDPLEEGMATHPSILTWRIPQIEEPGELQSMGL